MTAETFAPFCGPAVIASALGISRVDAASRILDVQSSRGRTHDGGGCHACDLAEVLGFRRETAFLTEEEVVDMGRICTPRLVSVARFLRAYPRGEAILTTRDHHLHTKDGQIIEHNGFPSRRATVFSVVWIERPPR